MAFLVKQSGFEGPLDLLLQLIRKNRLDICAIAISQVTNEYLAALDELQGLNLEVAGEYLVMAATLIHIKSRMLLPVADEDPEAEEDEEGDPGQILVERLREYQLFQEAALLLDRHSLLDRDVFARIPCEVAEENPGELEIDFYQFLKVCRESLFERKEPSFHQVEMENFSVSQRIEEIKLFLNSVPSADLASLFRGPPSPLQVVMTFLAVLELVRLRFLRLVQNREFGPIELWTVT
ncbi:MAG: segregation/condensation protein A [Desulfuromonadaceae bacterium]|nr:segregation/condensation protein A [Desulfuromonadaceae bacterium]